jgi:hypothetical protein
MRNFKKFLGLAMLLSPAWGMDKVDDNQSDSTRDGSDMLSKSSNAQSNKKPIASSIDQVEPKVVSVQEEEKTGPIKALPAEMNGAIKKIADMLFRGPYLTFDVAAPKSSEEGDEFVLAMDTINSAYKNNQTSLPDKVNVMGQANEMHLKHKIAEHWNWNLIKFIELILTERAPFASFVGISWMQKKLASRELPTSLKDEFESQLKNYFVCLFNNDQRGADETGLDLVNLLKRTQPSLPKILQNSKSAGGHAFSQQEKEQENFERALEALAQEKSKSKLSADNLRSLRESVCQGIYESLAKDLHDYMEKESRFGKERVSKATFCFGFTSVVDAQQSYEVVRDFFNDVSIEHMTNWLKICQSKMESFEITNQSAPGVDLKLPKKEWKWIIPAKTTDDQEKL